MQKRMFKCKDWLAPLLLLLHLLLQMSSENLSLEDGIWRRNRSYRDSCCSRKICIARRSFLVGQQRGDEDELQLNNPALSHKTIGVWLFYSPHFPLIEMSHEQKLDWLSATVDFSGLELGLTAVGGPLLLCDFWQRRHSSMPPSSTCAFAPLETKRPLREIRH